MKDMTLEELVIWISLTQKIKEDTEKKIKQLQDDVKNIADELEDKKCLLLAKLDEESVKTKDVDNLNATIFEKENIGYTSDNDVIKWLKDNDQSDYIKVKTTESLDKIALKKAIKTNEDLAKNLEQFTNKSVTRYVVVTSQENHQKMLEHINGDK